MIRWRWLLFGAVAILASLSFLTRRQKAVGYFDASRVLKLTLPEEFRPSAQLYAARCSSCHGARATGNDRGPPLVHFYYRKRYHPDAVFATAMKQGVKAHHWGFGDMPPAIGMSDDDITDVTIYLRWLQWQVGIR